MVAIRSGTVRTALALVAWCGAGSAASAQGFAITREAARAADAATIELWVDGRSLPRGLVRAESTIQVRPGPVDLYYVTWTPGNHTPSGPIENVVDLHIEDCRGNALSWDRDPTRVERISVKVPEGCTTISLGMTYIANQPNTNSRSTDTYGRPNCGVLNWNTVLWYPVDNRGLTNQTTTVATTLWLPNGWEVATSAPKSGVGLVEDPSSPGHEIRFGVMPLAELVDSPVIAGVNLVSHRMEDVGEKPHFVHLLAGERRFAEAPEWLLEQFEEVVRQTQRICGPFPRDEFHFLLFMDKDARAGVEHGESTFIATGEKALVEAEQGDDEGGGASLLVVPHEYFHAWCGKLRAPEGLVRSDFHTPAETDLLWVYEGLTAYYDEVLGARSGMITFEEYRQNMADYFALLEQRTGRLWRSVQDTARAARHLRQRGLAWYDLRQGQEYYGQGAMFWLEADAIIRRGTEGAKSLDDFCRALFTLSGASVPAVGAQETFTRDDVVRLLNDIYPGQDWDGLIAQRIESPVSSLEMDDLAALLGYRMAWESEPTALQKKRAKDDEGSINLRTSLGIRLNKEGTITEIVPGSPADKAGLAHAMKVIAVDGWVFSRERLEEAVKNTPETKQVAMTLQTGERIETKTIAYSGGMRWARLVRDEHAQEPDILGAIAAPRGE